MDGHEIHEGTATTVVGMGSLVRVWTVLGAAILACAGLMSAATTGAGARAALPASARQIAAGTVRVLATSGHRTDGQPSGSPSTSTAPLAIPLGPPMIGVGGIPPRIAGVDHAVERSLNWGGYAVSGNRGTLTAAQTTFAVPYLTSCGPTENSASSFWAGLDGFGTSTVEQDGVDAYCSNGSAIYFAWYELYPQSPVIMPPVSVHPGDKVVASVNFLGGNSFRLSVSDTTSDTGASVSVSLAGTTESTAECIAEDPGTTPVPYTEFGTISFSSCTVDGQPIGQLSPTALTTVSPEGAVVAAPSALTQGTAFTVSRPSTAPAPSPTPIQSPSPTRISAPPPLGAPVVGIASTPSGTGYWLADASGAVSAHGAAVNYGSMAGAALNAPITHIVATSDGLGYWLVAGDGGTFAFGDATFYGSMGGRHLNAPVVDMAPTADDGGYLLVAADGGIFAFGDAAFRGSMGGRQLNEPVVGLTADPRTGGYWLVAADGGVFAFSAPFYGSTGALILNRPIVALAAAGSGSGYWFVAADGGVFAFHAPFRGSTGDHAISAPIVGIAPDAATDGYWTVGRDGSVYSFSAPFLGSH